MKMHRMAALIGVCLAVAAVSTSAPKHVVENVADAKWGPAPPMLPPGAQIQVLAGNPGTTGLVSLRLKFPPGYRIPAHSHPTDENVVVLSGGFSMGMGDKLDEKGGTMLTPGGFGLMPANENHYAYTTQGAVIQLYAEGPIEFKYVNPADDPRNQKK